MDTERIITQATAAAAAMCVDIVGELKEIIKMGASSLVQTPREPN